MSEQIRTINIAVEMCGVILSFMGIILARKGITIEKKTRGYFIAIFSTLILYISSNIWGLLFKGNTGTVAYYGVRIANFGEFFFGYLLSFLFSLYILYCVERGNDRKRNTLRCWITAFFAVLAILGCL